MRTNLTGITRNVNSVAKKNVKHQAQKLSENNKAELQLNIFELQKSLPASHPHPLQLKFIGLKLGHLNESYPLHVIPFKLTKIINYLFNSIQSNSSELNYVEQMIALLFSLIDCTYEISQIVVVQSNKLYSLNSFNL